MTPCSPLRARLGIQTPHWKPGLGDPVQPSSRRSLFFLPHKSSKHFLGRADVRACVRAGAARNQLRHARERVGVRAVAASEWARHESGCDKRASARACERSRQANGCGKRANARASGWRLLTACKALSLSELRDVQALRTSRAFRITPIVRRRPHGAFRPFGPFDYFLGSGRWADSSNPFRVFRAFRALGHFKGVHSEPFRTFSDLSGRSAFLNRSNLSDFSISFSGMSNLPSLSSLSGHGRAS